MSGVLDRAAAFFVTPATLRAEPARLPPAVRAVVLGSAAEAVPLAAALALSLRAADRAPTALVAVWQPERRDEQIRRGVATRSAARLAARLSAPGLPATARGRLAWLGLPAEPAAAVAAVRRASAIVEGPLVTALTGTRPAELEGLLAEHDLAIVAAGPETPLARAALAGLAGQGIAAAACAPLAGALARTLAVAGLAAPGVDASRLARTLALAGVPAPAVDANRLAAMGRAE